ncbi:MAG: DegQ family serine endoprotease [Gammaproteobacteria bacterium]|nr:MAG: DegQ family serine endoprotease [Gammaproteobacteria bacterium]
MKKPLLLALLIAMMGGGALLFWSGPHPQASIPIPWKKGEIPSLAPMLENVIPGVVNVASLSEIPVEENPLFRFFFNLPEKPRKEIKQSLGSGFIIDTQRGYILSNYHVVEKAQDIVVTLYDGRRMRARLVGKDPATDVALLRIKGDDLHALSLGDSDALRVGDFVVAIGNPFGLGHTVTAGIVSALGRSGLGIEGYEDFIQTDASINPGHSGGPLVNLKGEVVGINTAILTPAGGNIGIGFAISINMARAVAKQLIRYGEVRRGQIGLTVQDLTPELARSFGLKRWNGAVVTQVEPGSPADKAGLRVGDIILAIDGHRVRDAADLRNWVGLARAGDWVTLEVLREGRRFKVKVKVAPPEIIKVKGEDIDPRLRGAVLGIIKTPEGTRVVVLKVKPGSFAHFAGLRRGDIILAINRVAIHTLADLKRAMGRNQQALMLHIRRGDADIVLLLQ